MTNLDRNFSIMLMLLITFLMSASLFIWLQTPDLFEYFNQAFCAH
jgi:hypothetical protein